MKKTADTHNKNAFTLIELLIVVAIIAILAAIAVPNFLEAQTRSKVSRTQNDLRTLTTAIETYRIDNNTYLIVGNPAAPSQTDIQVGFYERLWNITTPVAYISALPNDPFAIAGKSAGVGVQGDPLPTTDPLYCYCPGNFYFGQGGMVVAPEYASAAYSIAGRGPDGKLFFGALCMANPLALKGNAFERGSYDPTNGTMSEGDVMRIGGTKLN